MALLLDGSGSITGLSAGGLPDSSITAADIADGAITSAKLDTTTSQLFGMRNRIINGDMRIAQRGTSFSNPTAGFYTLDRWYIRTQNASIVSTITQSTTAPTGFVNSFYLSIGTGASSGSTDRAQLYQGIEGFNVADFGWGTANAQTVTLSFWVRSSKTGQFGGSLQNNAGNRSYPFIYTISSANTWEQKSVTIAGDTSGTWTTDNTAGIQLNFDLGAGSSFLTTASSWASGDYRGATGDTSIVATTGATFYITGVQLEVGSTATPFERRLYGNELALCQRYYYKTTPLTGNQPAHNILGTLSTTRAISMQGYPLPVTMRSSPTVGYNSMQITNAATTVVSSTISSITCYNTTTAQTNVTLDISYSAGGSGTSIYALSANNSGSYLDFSAEL